jgi:hypothetical protein
VTVLEPDDVTITMPREQWKALLSGVDMADMKYTPQGVLLLAAYQALTDALTDEQ